MALTKITYTNRWIRRIILVLLPCALLLAPVHAAESVKDLQNTFGFGTPQAIYKWQRGDTLPTVDNLAVLAALFGVKIDDILVFQGDEMAAVSA